MSKGGGKRTGGIVVVVGLLAALGFWLKGVIPGLGGDNSPSAVTSKSSPSEDAPKTAVSSAPIRHVVVKGEECLLDEDQPAACDSVCAILARGGPELHVAVDPTDGAHGVVETFETCLKGRGIKNIHLRNR